MTDRLTIADAFVLVETAALSALTANSASSYRRIWNAFIRFAAAGADGITFVDEIDPALVTSFLAARTRTGKVALSNTRGNRLEAMRYFFKQLRGFGLTDADPTRDLAVVRAVEAAEVRWLTDAEVDECRWVSESTLVATRYPLIWGLAESGAATGEIGWALWSDLDVERGEVRLSGGLTGFARTILLTPWAHGVFVQRNASERPSPTDPVAVLRAGSYDSRHSSVTEVLREILKRAGLRGELGVEPKSVAAWAGRRVFKKTGRLQDARQALGSESYDIVAKLIGLENGRLLD